MLNLYKSKIYEKINSEYITNSFYKKGLSLIKNKKLKNSDFIKFINYYPDLKTDPEFIDNFHFGIEFDEKNKQNEEFMNEILNNEKFDLKVYLGINYYHI